MKRKAVPAEPRANTAAVMKIVTFGLGVHFIACRSGGTGS
jgi:hypothetical protein